MSLRDQEPAIASAAGAVAAVRFGGWSLGKGLMSRIAFGCMCSVLVGVVTNLPYLKLLILWVCQVILLVFGRPDTPPSVRQKLDQIGYRGGEIIHSPADQPAKNPFQKMKDKGAEVLASTAVAPVKAVVVKTENALEEGKDKAIQVGEDVGDTLKKQFAKIGGAMPGGTPEAAQGIGMIGHPDPTFANPPPFITGPSDMRGHNPGGTFGMGKLSDWQKSLVENAEKERQIALERERASLIERAVKHGIAWKDVPTEKLRDEVVAAEAKRGPNAQCPFPNCANPFRIPASRKGNYICPKCRRPYSARAARALGAPRQNRMLGNPMFR